ncbi:MAG: Glycosyl hydrolase family 57 [candidate division TA06 bacterium ADurb.Bin131]|uniref:Glycosyl hydrolase family 57 n=1 Tax=candidate division TA06 bacterium ADurb.Bin131 TaxID=1852827 RepID=A0A1V6CA07_UNCT6|nr:MAG: Glycosyl hydrolase family 57 [candidate division TA06 bacterium ADurb.Bin131]HOC02040.1 glycoside hydrolase family 57 protein [bacterium]
MTYLNLCWHFHQPYYLLPGSNILESSIITFRVLYSYYPMALMLKETGVKLTCNITPGLILQIKKISDGEIIDGFQEMLISEASNDTDRIKIFLDELPPRIKERNNIFQMLIERFNSKTISKREILDLKMWMHLACIHPILLSKEDTLLELYEKGIGFTQKDKDMVVAYEKRVFSEILSIYRELFESGSIEISTTPGYHPIMPLVCDLSIASTTKTSLKIPDIDFAYPDDVRQHIKFGLDVAGSTFGKKIEGIWPAEGSISNQVLDILSEFNVGWIGADQQILSESVQEISSTIYTWKDLFVMFFRNHEFSDRIGFIYQSWDEKNAAIDLINRIEEFSGNQDKLLTIILDGENPWEWYRNEGKIFLNEFYQRSLSSSKIKMTTFSEAKNLSFKRKSISSIPAGSWMGLHFDNWIGKPDANKLWKILADTRKTVQQYAGNSPLYDEIMKLILMAECSDFFWWMSVPADQTTRRKFYLLFQSIISQIYKKAGLEIPESILEEIPMSKILKEPEAFISPVIDGKITNFFEWLGACEIETGTLWTTFQPFQLPVKKIAYGYDKENFYVRIDTEERNFSSVSVEFKDAEKISFDTKEIPSDNFVVDECVEIKIPWQRIEKKDTVNFLIRVVYKESELIIPPAGFFVFTRKNFDDDWQV